MVRFLVEHGACIFATTLSDQETAAEKCEEDEEGFDGCSEFLYSEYSYIRHVQRKFITRNVCVCYHRSSPRVHAIKFVSSYISVRNPVVNNIS